VCSVSAEKPPNIVFILADDQGWNALSIRMDPAIAGSGSTYFETPRLNQLARQGVRFTMAYYPSPTCGPTRTSIQYGQTPSTVGKFAEKVPTNLPPAADAMVRRLKAAHPQYRAAHIGKWHQRTRTPEELGYDVSDGQTMNQEGNSKDPDDPKLLFSMARRTNAFIDKQVKDGRPFFVQVSFYANHLKYQALPETIAKYEGKTGGRTDFHNNPLWAAMNEDMDTAIGNILKKLDDLGVADNTYVIYTADNGYENKSDSTKAVDDRQFYKAYPLKAHKYLVSEGGLRVAFIIRGPGIPSGVTSREPVVGWDIMPTVLDMAGAAGRIPKGVEGGSLLPHCRSGGKVPVKRRDPFMVFRYTKTNQCLDIAIVQDGYKFLRELRSGKEHLWSLWDDLGEQHNLLADMPEKADLLRRNMDGYFARLDWDQQEHTGVPMKGKKRQKPKKK
jgi:arylsulfatase A-like enzyme